MQDFTAEQVCFSLLQLSDGKSHEDLEGMTFFQKRQSQIVQIVHLTVIYFVPQMYYLIPAASEHYIW